MVRKSVAVLVVAAFGVSCGVATRPPTERQWIMNARGVVDQLRGDVGAVSSYDRVDAARAGLRNQSQLFGLLVSYTDLGGCRHMVAAAGAEPPGLTRAVHLMQLACRHLQRAETLFTRAVAREAPRLLAAASREADAAVPQLDAAALELARRA
jgi:hypothetical protein